MNKSGLLIPETFPLKQNRKGGALNLILTALLVEAGRMMDENRDIPTIEAGAKKAFVLQEGYLAKLDKIGTGNAVALMKTLSDPGDPFFSIYNNFFSPPKSFLSWLERHGDSGDGSTALLVPEKVALKGANDILVLELLTKRFQAVGFMVAVELVGSGVADLKDIDRACRMEFGWKEGPFSMMNRIGIEDSLQMVIEKMELSHRNEINFPIPKLLITQAQIRSPWSLNSKMQ